MSGQDGAQLERREDIGPAAHIPEMRTNNPQRVHQETVLGASTAQRNQSSGGGPSDPLGRAREPLREPTGPPVGMSPTTPAIDDREEHSNSILQMVLRSEVCDNSEKVRTESRSLTTLVTHSSLQQLEVTETGQVVVHTNLSEVQVAPQTHPEEGWTMVPSRRRQGSEERTTIQLRLEHGSARAESLLSPRMENERSLGHVCSNADKVQELLVSWRDESGLSPEPGWLPLMHPLQLFQCITPETMALRGTEHGPDLNVPATEEIEREEVSRDGVHHPAPLVAKVPRSCQRSLSLQRRVFLSGTERDLEGNLTISPIHFS
jgi:hypothetical protein